MLSLSNSTHQTLKPGELVMFDTEIAKMGDAICHRANNGTICLKKNGMYEILFRANVSGEPGTVQKMAIMHAGRILPETTMETTITTAADELGVASATILNNKCECAEKVFVKNIGDSLIEIMNPCIVIKRI